MNEKAKNKNRFTSIKNKISKLKKINIKVFLTILIFGVFLFLFIMGEVETKKLDIGLGDIAPMDIRATREFKDTVGTEEVKNNLIKSIQPRYRINPSVQISIKNTIRDFFEKVKTIGENEELTRNEKIDKLIGESKILISRNDSQAALAMDLQDLDVFENNIYDILNHIMSNGILELDLEMELNRIESVFNDISMTDNQKSLGVSIIQETLKPNKFIDEEETERIKEEEVNKIEPIIIENNQIILRQGDRVNLKALRLMEESGLLKEGATFNLQTSIGVFFLVALILLILFGYIYVFNKEIFSNNKLLIIIIIISASLILSKTLTNISPYIMPITAAVFLVSILIDFRLAIIINLLITFILGYVLKLNLNLLNMYFLSGVFAALLMRRQNQRYGILVSGLLVGVFNMLIILSFDLITKVSLSDYIRSAGYLFMNGLISSILTIGTLPIWENLFKVLTPLKLLELLNPNNPLQKRLLLEAPGTYHHSVIVGNLSESAAEGVGANSLIARVGAYYHDIGKLVRPYFFSENQIGINNPHNKLEANMSTLIITNHVKEGIALGQKHRLPKEIIDIIRQHHGTTLVKFFYHKAKQNDKNELINDEDFRYKGPKPQSKEAALVMLADSTEAAVRSIKSPTKKNIEEMIRSIIKDKLDDGQLDESGLTLKDISFIANSFSSSLMGIYHERVEYPKELEKLTVKEEN